MCDAIAANSAINQNIFISQQESNRVEPIRHPVCFCKIKQFLLRINLINIYIDGNSGIGRYSNAENVKLQTKEMQTSFCSRLKFTIEAPLFNTILYQCKHGNVAITLNYLFRRWLSHFLLLCYFINLIHVTQSLFSARKNWTKEITYTTTTAY